MDLSTYLSDPDRAKHLASELDTSVTYLKHHLAAGRKNISLDYALNIELATDGWVRADDLRPDFPWKAILARCPNCDHEH